MATKFSRAARVRARRTAVQALYQWYMTGMDMSDVIKEFKKDRSETKKADIEYFESLLAGIRKQQNEIEENYTSLLDRKIEEIDPVERAILDLGVYELLFQPELPWRVVINESVELAKMFGAEESHKYINGIMDKAAQNIRATEIESAANL